MNQKNCMNLITQRGYKIRKFLFEPEGYYPVEVELLSPHFSIIRLKALSLDSLIRELPESPFPRS